MDDVDEDEDEEEVVVFEDVGCAAKQAVAALRAAAASAAATVGKMEVMSSGRSFGAGGWGGPAVTWQPDGPIQSAAVGDRDAGLRSPPSGFCWARLLQCMRAAGLVSVGGNSSRGLYSEARGVGPGVSR